MLIIFVMTVFTYFILVYINRKDFSSPSVLLSASFLMAAMIFIWNIDNWELEIYGKTVIYVATAMVAFSLGTFIVRCLTSKVTVINNTNYVISHIEGRSFAGFAVISILCSSIYIAKNFKGVGNLLSFTQVLYMAYINATSTNESNVLLNQMKEIPIAIAYVTTYVLMVARDKKIRVKKLGLYISIVAFAILSIMTTDRNIILRYVIYTVCLWILFYKNRVDISKQKKNRTIVKKVIIILAVASVAFWGLGKAKQYTSNFERAIGIYGGSGLYNFNLTINNEEPLQYGASTFNALSSTVYAILGHRSNEVIHGAFINYRSSNGYIYSSNIYSALKPYTNDFGYLGVILFPLIIGFFFEFLFHMTKRRSYGFTWVFYAMSIYPLLYFSIAEQFFVRFHMGRVYEIFWVVFFYFIIFKVRVRFASSANSPEIIVKRLDKDE